MRACAKATCWCCGASPRDFAELAAHHGFLMLVPFAGEAKRRVRAPLALAILGATILAAATEWLPAPMAFLFGAVAMVATALRRHRPGLSRHRRAHLRDDRRA